MKYTKKVLENAVRNSFSFAQVAKHINGKTVGGSTQTHIANLIRKYKIDYSHFLHRSVNRGIPPKNRKSAKDILVKQQKGSNRTKARRLRRALKEIEREYICECGQQPHWNGKTLILQVDHINGDPLDNRARNLRFLCPNCHTQTDSFGSKNNIK